MAPLLARGVVMVLGGPGPGGWYLVGGGLLVGGLGVPGPGGLLVWGVPGPGGRAWSWEGWCLVRGWGVPGPGGVPGLRGGLSGTSPGTRPGTPQPPPPQDQTRYPLLTESQTGVKILSLECNFVAAGE